MPTILQTFDRGLRSDNRLTLFIREIVPFLQLQSSRRVTGNGLLLVDDDVDLITGLTLHVTHLSLPGSHTHALVFVELLKPLPHLASLSYSHCKEDQDDVAQGFEPPIARDGIMHLNQPLQDLGLVN
jgi:hypothetical protein